ncbi:MAG: phosphomannomutase/phosphoglucomutase, partial [Candidatus Woesearchaeota archaeon]
RKMSIFKAYDIRGVFGKDLTDETAYRIGLAYCMLRRPEFREKIPEIVVGCDMRLSSPNLKKNLIRGLNDGGFNVIDIGLASTPTFYFAVAQYRYDGGILVSASHNPKEYNGFKLVRERAKPISYDTGIREIERLVASSLEPSQKGIVMFRKGVLSDQIRHDMKYAEPSKIKRLKIVIDTANAMGSTYFDELFSAVKLDVVRMNWELDGTFPVHEADPFKHENVVGLCERVVREKADLGIATDGDGDRIFFFDERGEPVEPGIMRAILSRIFLRDRPGAKIAYDIRPGKITEDTIIEDGGVPVVTRVGHSLIKEHALREGAYFAGESSGHFFLNMQDGCYEVPVIVTLRILQELSESGKAFSDYVKPYQKYFHSGEINFTVEDPIKKIEEIKQKFSDARIVELDGVSIEYPDFWFNVRPSNTEALVRLNLEARSRDILENKKSELIRLLSG